MKGRFGECTKREHIVVLIFINLKYLHITDFLCTFVLQLRNKTSK